MSIEDKLDRLTTAKANHITVLEEKGVTVPSGSGFEDFATLIRSIEADPTGATAAVSHVLSPYTFYGSDGFLSTGTMTNNGAVSKTLDTSTTSYTIPSGYHNGSGKVSITTQTKSVTLSSSAQTITPDSGKVLSSVTVPASSKKTMYSGTQTLTSEATSMSISVGATLSSSAVFLLFATHGTSNELGRDSTYKNPVETCRYINVAVKNGSSTGYVITPRVDPTYSTAYGYLKYLYTSATISYSSSTVNITAPTSATYKFSAGSYKWYVFI